MTWAEIPRATRRVIVEMLSSDRALCGPGWGRGEGRESLRWMVRWADIEIAARMRAGTWTPTP